MAKSKKQPDLVNRAQEGARKNKLLAPFIIIAIIVIGLGTVSSQLDNIITFYEKYFTEESTRGEGKVQLTTSGNSSPITYVKEQNNYAEPKSNDSLPSADEITALGRRAAPWHNEYGGDRRSYLRLLQWRDTINDPVRKDLITTEVERVEKSYPVDVMRINIDNPHFWGYICKPHVNCTQGYENPTGFSAQNVKSHLGFNRDLWRERARAACILRNIKTATDKDSVDKEDLYEKLIGLMGEKENSLCVSKMALETYKDLTGFSSGGVFDFEGAKKDG